MASGRSRATLTGRPPPPPPRYPRSPRRPRRPSTGRSGRRPQPEVGPRRARRRPCPRARPDRRRSRGARPGGRRPSRAEEVDRAERSEELLLDPQRQLVDSGAGDRRDEQGVAVGVPDPEELLGIEQVDLVEHPEPGLLAGSDLVEHLLDRPAHRLELVLADRCVLDVDDQGGPSGLLERRPEGVDQLVGKLADKADGVGGQVGPPVDPKRPGQGIEVWKSRSATGTLAPVSAPRSVDFPVLV